MALGAWSEQRLARMRRVMSAHVESGAVPGIVTAVARAGHVHVDAFGRQTEGGRAMRADTIFRIASLTKPVAAVAALILIEECRLRLDEPVDRWLPELANRRVLRRIDGPLEEALPARRALTTRDLLTLRMGLGHLMAGQRGLPIQEALAAAGVLQGPTRPQSPPPPDAWMARIAGLPLMWQPGEQWGYDLGIDILGVLIARAAGQPLDVFMRERIFTPLGMKDTGFFVPAEKIDRLATSYARDPRTGARVVYDPAAGGEWSRPPAFPSAAGGLVSTVHDFLAFARMLLANGAMGPHGRHRLLSRPAIWLMTSDHVAASERKGMQVFFGSGRSWGLGVAVTIAREDLWGTPGSYGWTGGLGTAWANDPREGVIGILLTQQAMESPQPPAVFSDFWTSIYQAIPD